MEKIIDITIPIKTISEFNSREHWHVKAKRHTAQQWAVKAALRNQGIKIRLPCEIILTRISPRFLDSHDNLPGCFKFIVDEIARFIFEKEIDVKGLIRTAGLFDNDQRILWKYAQEKGKPQTIRIEIFF